MKNIKTKLKNNLAGILMLGGMGMLSSSIPIVAYLQYTQPKEPPIASKYRSLNQELHYLEDVKLFSLKDALDTSLIKKSADRANELSNKIGSIESSEKFAEISQYTEDKNNHNKYWFFPTLSTVLGVASVLYGIHFESKNNRESSELVQKIN